MTEVEQAAWGTVGSEGEEPRDPLAFLDAELAGLERAGLLREPPRRGDETDGAELLDLCSNDYLGYAAESLPVADVRGGAGASRLVSGNHRAHEEAEAALAEWLGAESALLFSSGYAANVGTIAALAGPGDLIVSDERNHASIIDGCRLSRAAVQITPHLDVSSVARALAGARGARRRWVVTESYFSMDGDSPDLRALRRSCDEYGAGLMVDEAHAFGVFGPRGRGLAAAAGIRADVVIGTTGKALGLQGAFVVGSAVLRRWLWNRARSFVFSTGVAPALAVAISERVRRAAGDEAGRARLHANAAQLRAALASLGLVAHGGVGPVIPWIVGSAGEAVRLSRGLRGLGVAVQAIRPPTVAPGSARLRITVTARLRELDLRLAAGAFTAIVANDARADG